MAHKRKDTYVAGEWAKHLRPSEKRKMAKAERRMARRMIDFADRDVVCHNFAFGKA